MKGKIAKSLPLLLCGANLLAAQGDENFLNCADGTYPVRGYTQNRQGGVVSVADYCRSYPASYSHWFPRLKDRRPEGWPYWSETHGKWTEAEKVRALEALSEIPEVLWIDSIDGIYRMGKSISSGNAAAFWNNNITVYDIAFLPESNLPQIVAHELAHAYFANRMSDGVRSEYGLSAGWIQQNLSKGRVHWLARPTGYVMQDGRESMDEDFANNVEYYLYHPDELKKTTPGAYEWIRKNFGKDFTRRKAEKK
ncbi:MAG: hypothetical protein HYW49_10880 [Deltaproteobacteria bacterium]|nr:hypothetical protein [Deltaproteobacteria bacterium]